MPWTTADDIDYGRNELESVGDALDFILSKEFIDGEVDTYGDLPSASEHDGEVWRVLHWSIWYPTQLSGDYYSESGVWTRLSHKPVFTNTAWTTADKLVKTSGSSTREIEESDIYVSQLELKKQQVIHVAKSGGDYDTIQAAIDSVTDATYTKQYIIRIAPGIYEENVIGKDYVNFIGSGIAPSVLNGRIILPSNIEIDRLKIYKEITTDETIVDGATNTGGRITLNNFTVEIRTSTAGVKPIALTINAGSIYTENFQVGYYNTSNASVGSETVLVDLQGGGAYIFTQSSFLVETNQTAGDIVLFNDNNLGLTTYALELSQITISNALWNDHFHFIKQVNNSSFPHVVSTLDVQITGGGLGCCQVFKVDSGVGVLRVSNSTFRVLNFTDKCLANAVNAGDEIDITFSGKNIEIDETEISCGNGKIKLFITTDGEFYVKNADIVDADFLIGSPTYRSLQDLFNIGFNAGWVDGQIVTDNGDGTTNISSGSGFVRTLNSEFAQLKSFDIASVTNQSYTVGDNCVYNDYNSGTPIVAVTTSTSTILSNENDKYEIARVIKESDDTLHISPYYHRSLDVSSLLQQRLYSIHGYERANGLALSESADNNRYVLIGTGLTWLKLNRITFPSFDTSGTDTMDGYYEDGLGGHTKLTGITVWDNTHYDDGTGVLATLGVAKYGYIDYYIKPDGRVVFRYGTNQYISVADASIVTPYSLPIRLTYDAIWVGRIIFQKNDTIARAVLSPFTTQLTGGGITTHNSLAGLQGGVAGEYYHLDATDYGDISSNTQLAQLKVTGTPKFVALGIGETSPETLLEITDATSPNITLHNSTPSNANNGRISRIFGIGHQDNVGTTEHTLGSIDFAHYGSVNDQKGTILFRVNDGSEGDSPGLVGQLTEAYLLWYSDAYYLKTAPVIIMNNALGGDGDGDRASQLNFMGKQSGSENTTLGILKFSHDGTSDDEKGKLDLYLNDGNDGDSPTLVSTLYSTGNMILHTGSETITAGNLLLTAGSIGLGITPNQKIHISGGNIQVNATNAVYYGFLSYNTDTAHFWNHSIASDDTYYFRYGGNFRASISSVDGTYTKSSDERLKENIQELGNILDKILLLEPVKYNMIGDNKEKIGFIAQEVLPHFPQAVSQTKLNDEDPELYYGLSYDTFGVLAIQAIKEQQQIINNLISRIEALENV